MVTIIGIILIIPLIGIIIGVFRHIGDIITDFIGIGIRRMAGTDGIIRMVMIAATEDGITDIITATTTTATTRVTAGQTAQQETVLTELYANLTTARQHLLPAQGKTLLPADQRQPPLHKAHAQAQHRKGQRYGQQKAHKQAPQALQTAAEQQAQQRQAMGKPRVHRAER